MSPTPLDRPRCGFYDNVSDSWVGVDVLKLLNLLFQLISLSIFFTNLRL